MMGRDAADYLSRYCSEIKREFDELQRPAQFSIGIEYRLVLTKPVFQGYGDLTSSYEHQGGLWRRQIDGGE